MPSKKLKQSLRQLYNKALSEGVKPEEAELLAKLK